MSNDSVHGNDANSQIGRGQGHRAIRDERSVEDQLQELCAMMANLTTQKEQITVGQLPRNNQ